MFKQLAFQGTVLLGLFLGLLSRSWVKANDEPQPQPPASATATEEKKLEGEYYQLFSLLVDTIDQVERNYVQTLSRRELVEAAIQGILHKLDPYSNYIAPEDITRFRTSVENQFGGIGIQVTSEGGGLKVLSPLVGSPAYRAGLQAGDRIVAIEDQPTDGLTIEDAVKKLKGEVGTQVNLSVQSPGESEPRKVTVSRELVHLETVLGDTRSDDDAWVFLRESDPAIGYIRLTGFSRDTATELRQVLAKLKSQNMRGLVLDLRFNPGGLLNSAIEVSDLFVSEGKIVSTEGRNTDARVWDAHAEGTFEGFPMAILVNRFSASSSEIVAACLQDHKRAAIVGERTWGKGSVQNVVELEGGRSALKLTTASYKRPSGKNIHRFPNAGEDEQWGVMPDEGLALKLDDDELRQLVEYRRLRDIVQPKKERDVHKDMLVAANPEQSAKQPTAPDRPAEPAKSDSNDKPTQPAGKDKTAPPSGEAPDDQSKPDGAEASGVTDRQDGKDSAFVDRQLRMAIEYIRKQLAQSPQ